VAQAAARVALSAGDKAGCFGCYLGAEGTLAETEGAVVRLARVPGVQLCG